MRFCRQTAEASALPEATECKYKDDIENSSNSQAPFAARKTVRFSDEAKAGRDDQCVPTKVDLNLFIKGK